MNFKVFKDDRTNVPKALRWENVIVLDTGTIHYGTSDNGYTRMEIWDTNVKILPKDAKKKN